MRDRYGTSREIENGVARISDYNEALDSNRELNETENIVRSGCRQERRLCVKNDSVNVLTRDFLTFRDN